MSSTTPESPLRLAGLVPDRARWVDLRGLLSTGRCDVWCGPDPELGFIAASRDFPFAVLWGRPEAEHVSAAVREARARHDQARPCDDWRLLADPGARDLVEAALPGWKHASIALHRWTGSLRQPPSFDGLEITYLPRGLRSARMSLDEFPDSSRRELTLDWVAHRPAAVACAESSLVSVCWAPFTTETLWDVAIETIPLYRRRGIAAACFLTLAAHMANRGLSPAWGAAEDNPGSLALATKLGFEVDGPLDSWSRSP